LQQKSNIEGRNREQELYVSYYKTSISGHCVRAIVTPTQFNCVHRGVFSGCLFLPVLWSWRHFEFFSRR